MNYEVTINVVQLVITIIVCIGMTAVLCYSVGLKDGRLMGRRQKELEEAYDQGQWDHGSRIQREDCPYEGDEELVEEWNRGWVNADSDWREHAMEMRRDLDEQ